MPLYILGWMLDIPASLPCGRWVPGAKGSACISMAWLCLREGDCQRKIPRQTQVSPRGGGECFVLWGWGGYYGNIA